MSEKVKIYMDMEVFSAQPIEHGTFAYAEHKTTKPLLLGYAIDEAPAKVWLIGKTPCPEELLEALKKPHTQIWHNGRGFDLPVLRQQKGEVFKLICSNRDVIDTCQLARMHALPGSLADLCQIFGISEDKAKDRDGKKLIRKFCLPTRVKGSDILIEPPHDDADWARFINYCRLDVEAERELFKRMPKYNLGKDTELQIVDDRINRRGIPVDLKFARAAIPLIDKLAEQAEGRTAELTGGKVESARQTKALKDYIEKTYGIRLKSMQKTELTRVLEDPATPEELKELLAVRLGSAKASLQKYEAMIKSANSDDRIRGTLVYRGASRTGRWAGKHLQPQNIARQKIKHPQVVKIIEAVVNGTVEDLYPQSEIPGLLSQCLRGAIATPEGKSFLVADYSNIEGRVLAYMGGESWKIEAFKECDKGKGYDLYELAYARAFGVDPSTVNSEQRQIGKTLELAMGYGGGVGAFTTFANSYDIDLDAMAAGLDGKFPASVLRASEIAYEKAVYSKRTLGLKRKTWVACECLKRLWRRSNPNIVRLWARCEKAALEAIKNPGSVHKSSHKSAFYMGSDGNLRHVLPSGRQLVYPRARERPTGCTFDFLGVEQVSHKWGRITTFGGKCVENLTQAVAADILGEALVNLEKARLPVIMHVHDEAVVEVPGNPEDVKPLYDQMCRLMATAPAWAEGLPLAVAGYIDTRYHK